MAEKIKLTSLSKTSGCAAKIGPGILAKVLSRLPKPTDPNLLVGTDTSDDAAVYKLTDDLAIIQTLDFFTPIVDDPYTFGAVAATNALSDIYAMGGTPVTALNIVAFPETLDIEILGEILRGGSDKVREAGASLAGGHSIMDDEPKYGLSVTGVIHPDKIWKNFGARPGDVLFLTKQVGSGLINTALKADMAEAADIEEAGRVMTTLNRQGKEVAEQFEIHAATDVTGFGLACHGLEMASASGVDLHIDTKRIPVMGNALEYAKEGLVPAGSYRNRAHARGRADVSALEEHYQDLVFDPQTSGGLLISVPAEQKDAMLKAFEEKGMTTKYACIGEVTEGEGRVIFR